MENGKITLSYKASNITKAEDLLGKSFLTCLEGLSATLSFSDMRFLVLAGGGTDDDFDALFASGVENLMTTVMEGINNSGFLGEENKIDVEAMKAQFHATVSTMAENGETSQSIGDQTKA